jgi:hypothetical protein
MNENLFSVPSDFDMTCQIMKKETLFILYMCVCVVEQSLGALREQWTR